MSSHRSFTVHSSNTRISGGRYISSTPISAAKDVAEFMYTSHPRMRKLTFSIRETTKGSGKIYTYSADKIKNITNKKYHIEVRPYKPKINNKKARGGQLSEEQKNQIDEIQRDIDILVNIYTDLHARFNEIKLYQDMLNYLRQIDTNYNDANFDYSLLELKFNQILANLRYHLRSFANLGDVPSGPNPLQINPYQVYPAYVEQINDIIKKWQHFIFDLEDSEKHSASVPSGPT